jgi:hypothetical protein
MVIMTATHLFGERIVAWVVDDEKWTHRYLLVTRPTGVSIDVDGDDIEGIDGHTVTPVGSFWEVVRVPITPGVHVVQGLQPIGVVVVATGWWIGTCYNGGMALQAPWDS